MVNIYLLFFIKMILLFQSMTVSSLPVTSSPTANGVGEMPKESHKFCKDMMGVLQQSGKDSFSAVVDTVKAAGSAVGFCAVECLKIFEKAIKSVITLNFKELANQVVKFGECFLDCVKQVLNIFKVGFQGANKVKNTIMSGVGNISKPNIKFF